MRTHVVRLRWLRRRKAGEATEASHLDAEAPQPVGIGRHRVVREESAHDAAQPPPLLWNGQVPAPLEKRL